jgi:hypothetical protein
MNMHQNWRTLMAMTFGLMLALVASRTLAQDVRANSMPGVDFAKCHTYRWILIPGGSHPNRIVDQEIKQSATVAEVCTN